MKCNQTIRTAVRAVVPALAVLCATASAAANNTAREEPEKYWDLEKLSAAPSFREAPFPETQCEKLRPLLVSGMGE